MLLLISLIPQQTTQRNNMQLTIILCQNGDLALGKHSCLLSNQKWLKGKKNKFTICETETRRNWQVRRSACLFLPCNSLFPRAAVRFIFHMKATDLQSLLTPGLLKQVIMRNSWGHQCGRVGVFQLKRWGLQIQTEVQQATRGLWLRDGR